jgi:hypothetical protein
MAEKQVPGGFLGAGFFLDPSMFAWLTLSQVYDHGTVAADQTLVLTDAHGGGVVLDATNAGYTGTSALEITITGGATHFYRAGGFDSLSPTGTTTLFSLSVDGGVKFSVRGDAAIASAAGAVWNDLYFATVNQSFTGAVNITNPAFARVYIGNATLSSDTPGLVIDLPSTVYVAGPPAAGANVTLVNPATLRIGSGALHLNDGAAGTPSLAFTSEPGSGLYRPGIYSLALALNSKQAMYLYDHDNVGGTGYHRLDVRSGDPAFWSSVGSSNADQSRFLYFFGGSTTVNPAIVYSHDLRLGVGAYDASAFTVHVSIASATGIVTITSLAGVGVRNVVVDASGVLSAP